MIYRIDFTKLVYQFLPPLLRGKVLMALLDVMIVPLVFLYEKFIKYRDGTNRTLDITANVEILEKALNDAFYLTDGQIYIVEPEDERVAFFWERETQPPNYMYLAPQGVFFKREDEAPLQESFIVWVPSFLCTSEEKERDKYGGVHYQTIIQILSKYKPAGRTYRIEIYDYE